MVDPSAGALTRQLRDGIGFSVAGGIALGAEAQPGRKLAHPVGVLLFGDAIEAGEVGLIADAPPLEGFGVALLLAVVAPQHPVDPVIEHVLAKGGTSRHDRDKTSFIFAIIGWCDEVLEQPLAALDVHRAGVGLDEVAFLCLLELHLPLLERGELDVPLELGLGVAVPEPLGLLSGVVFQALESQVLEQGLDDEPVDGAVLSHRLEFDVEREEGAEAMLMLAVTGAGVGAFAPVAGGAGGPEAAEGGVTVDVEGNDVAAVAVDLEPVLVNEVGGAPAVALLDPTFEPLCGLQNVGPTVGNFVGVSFSYTSFVYSNPKFRSRHPNTSRGTGHIASRIDSHAAPSGRCR